MLLGIAGGLFLLAAFGIAWRTVTYFKDVPEIGPLLAGKLLSMAFLAFSSILLLSNLITALSTFFLARDLDLLVSAPLDWGRFYLVKLGETIVHSSWMVVLLAVPLLAAYAMAWDGGILFPIVALAALIPLCVIPAVIGSAITLILVNVFPARRTRDLLGLVTIMAAGGLVLLLRVVRPEQLARPEGFRSLIDFIAVLRTPSHPLLPSEWGSAMIMNWLLRTADPLPVALLWTTAAAFVVMGAVLHQRLYSSGFARAQEGADSATRGRGLARVTRLLMPGVPVMRREFILKDLRLFFRDSTQWSQLILLGVLVADQGALILFVPFCTDEKQGYQRVRYCAQARAVENQMYVVMAGIVGNLPDVENMDIHYAESCILTPCDFPFARDGIAATSAPNTEMILFADLRLENLLVSRSQGTVQNLKDRRFDLYRVAWNLENKEE